MPLHPTATFTSTIEWIVPVIVAIVLIWAKLFPALRKVDTLSG